MANEYEAELEEQLVKSRDLITREIGQIAAWLKLQSTTDIANPTLTGEEHALANRVLNRVLHSEPEESQANNAELDSYILHAQLIREIVPAEIVSVYQAINDAARTITAIGIYHKLVEEGVSA